MKIKINLKSLFMTAAAVLIIGLQIVSARNILKYNTDGMDSAGVSRIRWISHRGHGSAPENTLSAYRLSAKKGYKYVECDVRFTRDMVPVLIHDAAITRTSDGSGLVKEYSFKQLQKYDFGRHKAVSYQGERIPSFDSFIALCADLGLHPYIDLKELDGQRAAILYDIVKKYGIEYGVTWISDPDMLIYIKNLIPHARLGILISTFDPVTLRDTVKMLKTPANTVFINAQSKVLDKKLADWCTGIKIPLEAWDVYDMSEARRLIGIGVTGITGDIIPSSYGR